MPGSTRCSSASAVSLRSAKDRFQGEGSDSRGGLLPRSLCIASAIFLTAHAASAQITGIPHTPKNVVAGIPATFTVTGTGACNVSLDYGDGTPPDSGVLNKPLSHTYALD